MNEQPNRRRGRPAIGGAPTLVRITQDQRAVAEHLGSGNVNAGVRRALDMAGAGIAPQGITRPAEPGSQEPD